MLTGHAACNQRRSPGLGRPGGSLVGATWAANAAAAKVGRAAELKTALVLDGLAARPGGPTVLHDLGIPIPNISANIDHVVVSGRRVLVIDSKGWRPARLVVGRQRVSGVAPVRARQRCDTADGRRRA